MEAVARDALKTYEQFLRESLHFQDPDVVIWNGDFSEQVQSIFASITGEIAMRQREVLVKEGFVVEVNTIDARVSDLWRQGKL